MFNPKFPFDGNQLILTSDRIIAHSKNDGIFLFGNKMIALSSIQTINLDCNEKILLDCPKIELGPKAETLGSPVILGRKFLDRLNLLITAIQQAAALLQTVAETNPGGSFANIEQAGEILFDACESTTNIFLNEDHPQNPLSKVTYTR
jgi:hypothetical protein